jgi:hypothetical protein
MRMVKEGAEGAQPLVRLDFSVDLGEGQIRAIEEGMVENGLGGWTWAKGSRGTALIAACVPQWGGDAEAHVASMTNLQRQLRSVGFEHQAAVYWIQPEVMERGEYDQWIRG